MGTVGRRHRASPTPAAATRPAPSPGSPTRPGGFLPLVCTLNAARVLDAAARMLGVDHDGCPTSALVRAARCGRPRAGALPRGRADARTCPRRTGSLHGLTLARRRRRPHLARAAVEGMLCGLADGLDALAAHGARCRAAILLVGGGAASEAVRAIAPDRVRPSGRGARPRRSTHGADGACPGRPGGVGAVGRGGAPDLDRRHERVVRRPGRDPRCGSSTPWRARWSRPSAPAEGTSAGLGN